MTTMAHNEEAGNLTTDQRGYSYEYHHENRIVKITRGQTGIVEFWYDVLGRRVMKLDHIAAGGTRFTAGGTRWCYYDKGWRAVDEFRKSATSLVPK